MLSNSINHWQKSTQTVFKAEVYKSLLRSVNSALRSVNSPLRSVNSALRRPKYRSLKHISRYDHSHKIKRCIWISNYWPKSFQASTIKFHNCRPDTNRNDRLTAIYRLFHPIPPPDDQEVSYYRKQFAKKFIKIIYHSTEIESEVHHI
jgi:hypothetical protein